MVISAEVAAQAIVVKTGHPRQPKKSEPEMEVSWMTPSTYVANLFPLGTTDRDRFGTDQLCQAGRQSESLRVHGENWWMFHGPPSTGSWGVVKCFRLLRFIEMIGVR